MIHLIYIYIYNNIQIYMLHDDWERSYMFKLIILNITDSFTIFNNLFSYPLILNNYYILNHKRKLNGLFSTIKVLLLWYPIHIYYILRQFNDNYLRLINNKINYRILKINL